VPEWLMASATSVGQRNAMTAGAIIAMVAIGGWEERRAMCVSLEINSGAEGPSHLCVAS
jgi:hypothetical protein